MTRLRSWAGNLRRFLRLKARSGIGVRMEGYEQMAVALRDVSRGGFAIIAAAPFAPGDRYRFRFDLPSGKIINVRAVAVHGCREQDAGGPAAFVSGWRFLLKNAAADIDLLVEAAGEPCEPETPRSATRAVK